MSSLSEISSISNSKERISAYSTYVSKLVAKKDVNNLLSFVNHIIDNSVPPLVSRPSLIDFSTQIVSSALGDDYKPLVEKILSILEQRAVAFEEHIAILRTNLADFLEQNNEYLEAAKCLGQIPMEGSIPKTDEEKAKHWVHIAHLYLAEDKSEYAETWTNKASQVLDRVTNLNIKLKYQYCFAQIQARREFQRIPPTSQNSLQKRM
jgi:tetratricopeptide (TPR) repeat protein